MDKFRAGFAMLFVALFAVIWVWIGWKLWHFTPTKTKKTLDLSNDVVNVAGFLASSVAAGTAAVLGVKIQKQSQNGQNGNAGGAGGGKAGNTGQSTGNRATAVVQAARSSILLKVGIAVYAIVGMFVAVIWITHTKEAPDMIRAFSWGVVGWLAGSYTAVFRE